MLPSAAHRGRNAKRGSWVAHDDLTTTRRSRGSVPSALSRRAFRGSQNLQPRRSHSPGPAPCSQRGATTPSDESVMRASVKALVFSDKRTTDRWLELLRLEPHVLGGLHRFCVPLDGDRSLPVEAERLRSQRFSGAHVRPAGCWSIRGAACPKQSAACTLQAEHSSRTASMSPSIISATLRALWTTRRQFSQIGGALRLATGTPPLSRRCRSRSRRSRCLNGTCRCACA
jgi:hypothetical protein